MPRTMDTRGTVVIRCRPPIPERVGQRKKKGKKWQSSTSSPRAPAGVSRRSRTSPRITCTTPEKSLLEPLPKKAGRNNNGRITTRHQGGGHKRQYRKIDFKRRKDDVPAKVATIEYDPQPLRPHRAAPLR